MLSEPAPKGTELVRVDSHPIRQEILSETKALSTTQVVLPSGMAIATFIVNCLRGDVVSVWSGIFWAFVSLVVGLVLYYLIAVIRSPFVVIGKQHNEIAALLDRVSQLESKQPVLTGDANQARCLSSFSMITSMSTGRTRPSTIELASSTAARLRLLWAWRYHSKESRHRHGPKSFAQTFRTDSQPQMGPQNAAILTQARKSFFTYSTWQSSTGEVMVDGIDTKRDGSRYRFPMERDERWHFYLKVSCANAEPKTITLFVEPLQSTVNVTEINQI